MTEAEQPRRSLGLPLRLALPCLGDETFELGCVYALVVDFQDVTS